MNIVLYIVLSTVISAAMCGVSSFLVYRSLKQRFAQRVNYDKISTIVRLAIEKAEKKNAEKVEGLRNEITALREQRPQEDPAVDFNAGIAAILGYDPMEVRKKMRES